MTVQLSLSEIDALCRKAARGAGYSWGMAEEAGRAARWLAAFGFQGPEALAAWLTVKNSDHSQHFPQLNNKIWRASRVICPLTAGTLVSDRESQLLRGQEFDLLRVQQPLLMLPQVARIAEASQQAVMFSVNDETVYCAAQGIVCGEDFPWHMACANVVCSLAESDAATLDEIIEPSAVSRAVDDAAFEALQQLAHRTYAPATEASRLAGAGSCLNDND